MESLENADVYTIGWIAALPIERAAATALLDDRHSVPQDFEQNSSDSNSYTWGRMGVHNIVIASLPDGQYGTTSAATTASNLLASLPQIRIGLMVGIGGGISRPAQERDVRLGDVVVGRPSGTIEGVLQYDLGKAKSGQAWERTGQLSSPPQVLLNALSSLRAEHEIGDPKMLEFLKTMWEANPKMRKSKNKVPAFIHQGFEHDRLFKSGHAHPLGNKTCEACEAAWEEERDERDTTDPEIHYGLIASGNTLVKDADIRDKILQVVGEDCICLEMEAAGLMNHFPCLVIRGICDYADSHKNDRWQRYASATAAAFAKELLTYVPVKNLKSTQKAIDILRSVSEDLRATQAVTISTKEDVENIR
ncbi:unnamed protein product [Clonostachys byssicola]|uniref:Nucleoside phosphorylase domain-containing protein n=1 Tax=Clonostachys byssicola TaxID=160290 RepID=A0A9N9XV38_9HYPO|nr:unnamed protein product [Clonostachys byssicola]